MSRQRITGPAIALVPDTQRINGKREVKAMATTIRYRASGALSEGTRALMRDAQAAGIPAPVLEWIGVLEDGAANAILRAALKGKSESSDNGSTEDAIAARAMDRAFGLNVQGYRAPYRREDGTFVHPINRPSDVRARGGR